MTALSDLQPGPTDRACFLGMTGSGKTVLAEHLLRFRPYVVVLDVKGTLNWAGYTLFTSLETLQAADPEKHPRMIWRPTWQDLGNVEILDSFFRWIYLRKNCTVYVDEIQGVATATDFPGHMAACIQRGRELGVCLWASSQRPSRIPMIVVSEAEYSYTFRLRIDGDRKRMAEVTGMDPDVLADLPKHYFYFSPLDGDSVGPLTLELNNGK